MCTQECAGHAAFYGEPAGRTRQSRRDDRDQGRQRVPGRDARWPPADRCRPSARTLVQGLPLPLRARAADLRRAATAAHRYRRCRHGGGARAHESGSPARRRSAASRRVAAPAAGAQRRGRGCAAPAHRGAELPPPADQAAARAATWRGLPADARTARHRAEARAPGARGGPRGVHPGRARRGTPCHSHTRDARRALPRRRLAGLRPGSGGSRRDRPRGGLRGLREQGRRGLEWRAPQAPPRHHRGHIGRSALQPDPGALAPRPRSPPLGARWALVLRRGRAVVRHAVRARQPDQLVPDALVRARDRRGDAEAAGGPPRPGVQRRARRGAGQGPARVPRGRAGRPRRDALRALLRLGGCHAYVSLPARPPRRLVRQPRPVPRAARAGGGGARVDRPLRGSRRGRPRRVPAPLAARACDAGLEGLRGRDPGRRRRAARRAGGARGGSGLRDPREAADGAHVRARRRRRARRAPARRGCGARGASSSASGCRTAAATRSASTAKAPGVGAHLEPGTPALVPTR